MLSSIDLNDKTYEELITEAISQIPLHSKEWTNFNRSDPGITILQNFSAFNVLQQSYINEVTDDIRRRLLEILGFKAGEHRDARLLLESRNEEAMELPANRKLMGGGLCFETMATVSTEPWGVKAVYSVLGDDLRDVTYLLARDAKTSAAPFGAKPAAGAALLCVLGGEPRPGETLILHAKASAIHPRNDFDEDFPVEFARVSWELFTDAGWLPLKFRDESHAFLISGELRLEIPKNCVPAEFTEAEEQGFALRCVLEENKYGLAPRLHSLSANLFEVSQRDTKAVSIPFNGASRVELYNDMAVYGFIYVFCRESRGEPYRLYKQYTGREELPGRFYTATRLEDNHIIFNFDKKRFGFAPGRGWGAVRVVCYEEEMVHHRDLGPVYGYENQLVDIDLVENVLPAGFCVLVESEDKDGVPAYAFAPPEMGYQDALCYRLLSETGQLLITDPGMSEGCRLFVCDCAITAGAGGNIREGNSFTAALDNEFSPVKQHYVNPAPGKGGATRESPEELRKRFGAVMKSSTSCVTARDYENIVRKTPGLCIHKVKAVTDAENNLVKVAVKPYTEDRFSRLSPLYRSQISAWLEPKRMITTRLELLQPKYIPIDVQATIYVKSYFEDARRQVEELLESELDYIASDREFGDVIHFNEVFRALEALPCVDSVYELILMPRYRGEVTFVGADIRLHGNCLCYAGRMTLELNSQV